MLLVLFDRIPKPPGSHSYIRRRPTFGLDEQVALPSEYIAPSNQRCRIRLAGFRVSSRRREIYQNCLLMGRIIHELMNSPDCKPKQRSPKNYSRSFHPASLTNRFTSCEQARVVTSSVSGMSMMTRSSTPKQAISLPEPGATMPPATCSVSTGKPPSATPCKGFGERAAHQGKDAYLIGFGGQEIRQGREVADVIPTCHYAVHDGSRYRKMSISPKVAGTTATLPCKAAGSATALSMATRSRPGQTSFSTSAHRASSSQHSAMLSNPSYNRGRYSCNRRCLGHEHPGVPPEFSCADVPSSHPRIGFLLETIHETGIRSLGDAKLIS